MTFSDYQVAKSKFEYLCKNVGIHNNQYGYFGSISYPGISDIDAAVIGTCEQLQRLHKLFSAEKKNNAIFDYVFWHPPVYIESSILNDVHFLHTLENLNLEALTENKKNTFLDRQDDLYLVWFTFLIRVCISILRGRKISLRLLLLVYKNLEASELFFCNQLKFEPNKLENSQQIRELIFSHKISKDYFFSIFKRKFEFLLSLFDQYCFILSKNKSLKYRGFFILSKNTIISPSSKSDISLVSNIAFLKLNQFAFNFLIHFVLWDEYVNNSGLFDYFLASKKTAKFYRENNLHYSFVTPFGINIQNNQVSRKINKLIFNTFNSLKNDKNSSS
ncbi:hypothetical protein SYNPCC7002_A0411 [Picosynechococcus sp. PCC 7002]|nr:hypothetical protein SYNPCC7002_A0411 [Picosynechococcus sp. PCC 7002]